MTGIGRLSWPRLARVVVRSPGHVLIWHRCVALMNEFVNNDNEVLREVPVRTIIKQRDPFLRIKKSVGGPTSISVGQ